jgi:putative DNA primase/helicase
VRLAKKSVRERYKQAETIEDLVERAAEAKWAIQSENRLRLEALLALARAEKPIADRGDCWDSDGWLLGVANGVVDLRTGKLRPGTQADGLTMHTDVMFDPNAECPRWERFVAEIFNNDEGLINYIWRAAGYSLTGDTREQCHFLCWGSGWNGKTTFQRVQRELLGDYGANTPFATLEMSSRSGIPNDLAELLGKLRPLGSTVFTFDLHRVSEHVRPARGARQHGDRPFQAGNRDDERGGQSAYPAADESQSG